MTDRPTTSTRTLDEIASGLTRWFQGHPDLLAPSVELRGRPRGAGLSSDTVLFDLSWRDVKGDHRREYVLRMPPPADAYPLFPWYDLDRQVRAMQVVAERTDVPVPVVPWYEQDPTPLGVPFFVMERVHGVSPADIPLY